MTLHNLQTTITPAEHTALHNVLSEVRGVLQAKKDRAVIQREALSPEEQRAYEEAETAALWLAAQAERFYEEWASLPSGSHLKEAYADQVWTWSDRDLA